MATSPHEKATIPVPPATLATNLAQPNRTAGAILTAKVAPFFAATETDEQNMYPTLNIPYKALKHKRVQTQVYPVEQI